MRTKCIPALGLCALVAGCASVGQQMSADKIAAIKPGTTTRAEMVDWFGEPTTVGLDASGVESATWHHAHIIAAPFYSEIKQQVLVAQFTNSVVKAFVVTDQIKETNAPPSKAVSK
ncbi:MAG TPA: hypothetical protein VNO52_04285 [Methylomirabilota bacterium]|nr:hypothetical protein [Methylomirabilota bacterium]